MNAHKAMLLSLLQIFMGTRRKAKKQFKKLQTFKSFRNATIQHALKMNVDNLVLAKAHRKRPRSSDRNEFEHTRCQQ